MIIDCIGCLHGHFPTLEGGDLLIVTGDLTAKHTEKEHFRFNEWIENQKYKKVIVIAGNHDTWIEDNECLGTADYDGQIVEYLCNSGTEFEGLKIWGSPASLWFKGINPKCNAFTGSEKDLSKKWALIPDDTDILITHSPPYGILDGIPNEYDGSIFHVGSKSLALEIGKRENVPKLWVWSHIHEAYGKDLADRVKDCKMMNCSHVNEHYQPVNKPIRIEL